MGFEKNYRLIFHKTPFKEGGAVFRRAQVSKLTGGNVLRQNRGS